MTVCPDCGGSGDKVQLKQGILVGGTDIDPCFAGSQNVELVNGQPTQSICNGCNGTGIYRNFGV
jgi:hypothetical protein